MSEESDNEDGSKTRHSPKWRSDSKDVVSYFIYKPVIFLHLGLNLYIKKLDDRTAKRLGNRQARCVTRVYGEQLNLYHRARREGFNA